MNFKNLKRIIFFCGVILLMPYVAHAQKPSKETQLKQLFKPATKHNYNQYLVKSSNELEATGALLFLGYKSFFSSQDMNSCVFTPSCSVYAIESFQNDNPIKAYLKVFDRLSRCHPFTAKNEYPYYKNTTQLYDPVL